MRRLGSRGLFLGTLLLFAGAAVAVASTASRGADAESRSRGFQDLVHGLGLGPATDLSRCEPDFDSRIGDTLVERTEPVPAGDAFSAHRVPPNATSR